MAVEGKRRSLATTQWMKVFPRQATETYTHSVKFIKQLTTVAISAISFLRNTFSEDNFTMEKFADLRLMILKKECRDKLAQFTSTGLADAFEAIDKQYLHKLVFCYYENEYAMENLKEYYMFEYSYTSNGVTMTMDATSPSQGERVRQSVMYSFECVRELTIDLIQRCIGVTQSIRQPLPPMFDISMQAYYNDNAPEGYQAPGFLASTERVDHLDTYSHGCFKIGSVETRFHRLKLQAFLLDELRPLSSSNETDTTSYEKKRFEKETEGVKEKTGEVEGDMKRVECVCALNDLHLTDATLTCDFCGRLQHAVCYGRRTTAGAGGVHCCLRCRVDDPQRPFADHLMLNVHNDHRRSYCVVRRALAWLCGRERVSSAVIAACFQLRPVHAAKLLQLLKLQRVVDASDTSTSTCKVVPAKLEEMMSKYFYDAESEVTERLVVESLTPLDGPQAPQDPLAQLLRPLERVALHHATAVGKSIDPPQTDTAIADATLKQYREAIVSNQPEEESVPLSGNHNPVPDMDAIGKGTKRKGAANRRPGINKKRAKKSDITLRNNDKFW